MKTKKLYAWVIAVAILLSQATPVRAEQGGTSYDQSEVCI